MSGDEVKRLRKVASPPRHAQRMENRWDRKPGVLAGKTGDRIVFLGAFCGRASTMEHRWD